MADSVTWSKYTKMFTKFINTKASLRDIIKSLLKSCRAKLVDMKSYIGCLLKPTNEFFKRKISKKVIKNIAFLKKKFSQNFISKNKRLYLMIGGKLYNN